MDKNSAQFRKNIVFALVVGLSTLSIFSLGYFVANSFTFQRPPIVVERISTIAMGQADGNSYPNQNSAIIQGGQVVASANSDKYHFEWCLSAARIKEENKIFFESASLAEAAGLTLAGNCR